MDSLGWGSDDGMDVSYPASEDMSLDDPSSVSSRADDVGERTMDMTAGTGAANQKRKLSGSTLKQMGRSAKRQAKLAFIGAQKAVSTVAISQADGRLINLSQSEEPTSVSHSQASELEKLQKHQTKIKKLNLLKANLKAEEVIDKYNSGDYLSVDKEQVVHLLETKRSELNEAEAILEDAPLPASERESINKNKAALKRIIDYLSDAPPLSSRPSSLAASTSSTISTSSSSLEGLQETLSEVGSAISEVSDSNRTAVFQEYIAVSDKVSKLLEGPPRLSSQDRRLMMHQYNVVSQQFDQRWSQFVQEERESPAPATSSGSFEPLSMSSDDFDTGEVDLTDDIQTQAALVEEFNELGEQVASITQLPDHAEPDHVSGRLRKLSNMHEQLDGIEEDHYELSEMLRDDEFLGQIEVLSVKISAAFMHATDLKLDHLERAYEELEDLPKNPTDSQVKERVGVLKNLLSQIDQALDDADSLSRRTDVDHVPSIDNHVEVREKMNGEIKRLEKNPLPKVKVPSSADKNAMKGVPLPLTPTDKAAEQYAKFQSLTPLAESASPEEVSARLEELQGRSDAVLQLIDDIGLVKVGSAADEITSNLHILLKAIEEKKVEAQARLDNIKEPSEEEDVLDDLFASLGGEEALEASGYSEKYSGGGSATVEGDSTSSQQLEGMLASAAIGERFSAIRENVSPQELGDELAKRLELMLESVDNISEDKLYTVVITELKLNIDCLREKTISYDDVPGLFLSQMKNAMTEFGIEEEMIDQLDAVVNQRLEVYKRGNNIKVRDEDAFYDVVDEAVHQIKEKIENLTS